MKKIIIAVVTCLALTACGDGGVASHPKIHVHGTFAEESLTNGNCGLSPGDQVKITSGDGKLLATPTLGQAVTKTIKAGGVSVPLSAYPFSATVPAESRYGLTVGSMPVFYVSKAAFRKGVDLTC